MEPEGDVTRWIDTDLADHDGQVVGRIVEIFLDADSREPEWAAVAVDERGSGPVLVPLAGAGEEGGRLRVPVTREQVLSAPEVPVAEGRISPQQEEVLERHYSGAGDGRGEALDERAAGGVSTTRHDAIDDVPALTRSEEELVVERRALPRERVRLVKRVVTETVTRTVDVRREELHVERVPLGAEDEATLEGPPGGDASPPRGRSGLAERLPGRLGEGLAALERQRARLRGGLTPESEPFSDEVVDVTLFAEEVVVTKRVVPRERVRLRRAVVTEAREVHDDLRKERVELEAPSGPERLGAAD